jgi:hypothetical protein
LQRSPFDLAVSAPDEATCDNRTATIAFLNQGWVQRELGVPLNFTISSNIIVTDFFAGTGDPFRLDIKPFEDVLSRNGGNVSQGGGGMKVAMVYGDRDYRCNCESLFYFQVSGAELRARLAPAICGSEDR